MSKYSKFEKYLLATPVVSLTLFIVGLILLNWIFMLISSVGLFIVMPLMAYIGEDILLKKYPNIADPEEVKRLKDILEKSEVKEYIHYLHYVKHKNVLKIAQRIEKKFKIKLHHKWGRLAGEIKNGLDDKISQILGYKNYGDYWGNHGILLGFWPIEVEYDFSQDSSRPIKKVYPYGKKRYKPEALEDPRIFKKQLELIKLEEIASKYYKKGKYTEAIKWYELKLNVLLEIREPEHPNILDLKEKIENIKSVA